jgi:hypothetical protein
MSVKRQKIQYSLALEHGKFVLGSGDIGHLRKW